MVRNRTLRTLRLPRVHYKHTVFTLGFLLTRELVKDDMKKRTRKRVSRSVPLGDFVGLSTNGVPNATVDPRQYVTVYPLETVTIVKMSDGSRRETREFFAPPPHIYFK